MQCPPRAGGQGLDNIIRRFPVLYPGSVQSASLPALRARLGICVKCEGGEAMPAEGWDNLRFSFEAMDDLGQLPEDAWNHLSCAALCLANLSLFSIVDNRPRSSIADFHFSVQLCLP